MFKKIDETLVEAAIQSPPNISYVASQKNV